jgi:hypothetical protein
MYLECAISTPGCGSLSSCATVTFPCLFASKLVTSERFCVKTIAVCIATGYGPDDGMIGVRFSAEAGNFFDTASRPVLGPTQPPI